MSHTKPLIRFDWAMKPLLRDKANFEVLEGFLTTLLGRGIKIDRILESEGNRESESAKFNRVDILAQSTDGEKMLIEVQNQTEIAYFHRMLFGTARLIGEYTKLGDDYGKISKIYSINIVYFPLGVGNDSVYVGETVFRGLHDNSILGLHPAWKKKLLVQEVKEIFPIYYILRVNDFDRWSKTPLDQWLYFLSKGALKEGADAPGMEAVQQKLQYASLSKAERDDYRRKLDDQTSLRNGFEDVRYLSREEGRQEGREEGRLEEKLRIAKSLKDTGLTLQQIADATGLDPDAISSL